MQKFTILFFFMILLSADSCEDWLYGETYEDEYTDDYYSDDGGSSDVNPGYDYTYSCPVSGSATVPIPAGTTECQNAYEAFARAYGCNNVDDFNAANCGLCYSCDLSNYCSVCE